MRGEQKAFSFSLSLFLSFLVFLHRAFLLFAVTQVLCDDSLETSTKTESSSFLSPSHFQPQLSCQSASDKATAPLPQLLHLLHLLLIPNIQPQHHNQIINQNGSNPTRRRRKSPPLLIFLSPRSPLSRSRRCRYVPFPSFFLPPHSQNHNPRHLPFLTSPFSNHPFLETITNTFL